MPLMPACATPAPISPPTSAWLDEEGIPLTHVTMFQNIAPTSAPNTTAGVTRSLTIRPLPIVSATLCSAGHLSARKKAAKLKKAAKPTAATGLISRVPTTVAIELAASCRPFRKSNASATTMRPTSSGSASWCIRVGSGVVDHDAVDLVCDVFHRVRDPLEMLVDLAGNDELHR